MIEEFRGYLYFPERFLSLSPSSRPIFLFSGINSIAIDRAAINSFLDTHSIRCTQHTHALLCLRHRLSSDYDNATPFIRVSSACQPRKKRKLKNCTSAPFLRATFDTDFL